MISYARNVSTEPVQVLEGQCSKARDGSREDVPHEHRDLSSNHQNPREKMKSQAKSVSWWLCHRSLMTQVWMHRIVQKPDAELHVPAIPVYLYREMGWRERRLDRSAQAS